MVSPATSLIDDLAANNYNANVQYIDAEAEEEEEEEEEEEAAAAAAADDDDLGFLSSSFELSPSLLRRTNSAYACVNDNHHQPRSSFLSHFISSLPSTVPEEEEQREGNTGEALNNSPLPVLGTLRRSVTAPENNTASSKEDPMTHHTQEQTYNGVFRPAFVTRWNSFVEIKEENKRYELGTWTTKESAARAHDAALLFMRGDTKETREMMNFPVSEYESTLKDLKDMNVVTTNEEFVELLVESSVKVERRQSRHRGVVKSKEHTNKYEARIFLDEI